MIIICLSRLRLSYLQTKNQVYFDALYVDLGDYKGTWCIRPNIKRISEHQLTWFALDVVNVFIRLEEYGQWQDLV